MIRGTAASNSFKEVRLLLYILFFLYLATVASSIVLWLFDRANVHSRTYSYTLLLWYFTPDFLSKDRICSTRFLLLSRAKCLAKDCVPCGPLNSSSSAEGKSGFITDYRASVPLKTLQKIQHVTNILLGHDHVSN